MVAVSANFNCTEITIADLLVYYLEALGIEYVFGIPGGAIEPLYNALARSERRNGVRAIVARHETGAAFMADGYTFSSGRLAVCCATTGPGATNLVTGVASAFANKIPMLVITAQTSIANFGRGAFQDSSCTGINTLGIFEHCTQYNTLVSHVDQFEHKLITALMTSVGASPGPVHLSIPLDVLRSTSKVVKPSFDVVKLMSRRQLVDLEAVGHCCRVLQKSRKTVFVIGEGASDAIEIILSVAARLGTNILTTPHGKGLISPYHPNYFGVVGFAGHRSARDILADPELEVVICVGTKMGEWASNGWDVDLLLNSRIIHIDEHECNLTFTPMAQLHVRGRILTVFEYLDNHFKDRPPLAMNGDCRMEMKRKFALDDESAFLDDSTPIKPQRLMRELPLLFPPGTRYFADTGSSFAWAIHYLHPFDHRILGPRPTTGALFRSCLEFSSMGWAIGCAVGAALAARNQPVVCITGDGSMLMSGQEITVAVQEKLPVIFVVLNDSALGMVKHGQRLANAEQVGVEIPVTDFAACARAMGANGIQIRSPQDLLELDADALCRGPGPSLLDVYIDQQAVPPIGFRIQTLNEY